MAKNSLLENRYRERKLEREKIREAVNSKPVNPDEDEQKAVASIIETVSRRFSKKMQEVSIDELVPEIKNVIEVECEKLSNSGKYSYTQSQVIKKAVEDTVLGCGPIQKYLDDPDISEVIVERYDRVLIESGGMISEANVKFIDEDHLMTIIKRIVQRCGRQINVTTPIVDARLKDGSRVNAVIMPVSPDGARLTIRKFNNAVLSGEDYIKKGSLNKEMLTLLSTCVRAKITIFVSGGTGTGKTTLLNMLSGYIPKNELIITIEDICELKLQQPHVRRTEVRTSKNEETMNVDQAALVANAMRERPDRIILGEVRDGSIVDLISAMSTGHEGSMSTIHANSPRNMVDVRIPILYSKNASAKFSEKSIAMQIAEAIQLIVQIERMPNGERKITSISYIDGITKDAKVIVKDIYVYDREKKDFVFTGNVPEHILQIFKYKGVEFDDSVFRTANNTAVADSDDSQPAL